MSAHAAKLLTCLDLAVKIQVAAVRADPQQFALLQTQNVCAMADALISWFDARVAQEQSKLQRQFEIQKPASVDANTKTD